MQLLKEKTLDHTIKLLISEQFPTIRSDATSTSRHDGNSHHDESTCTPPVLHQKLLKHDVPKSLHENQICLLCQCLICLHKQILFYLKRNSYYNHSW